MRTLSASAVLEVWERGVNQTPVERALEMLSAACPETPREDLLALSMGRRDAALFSLQEQMFGPEMTGVAACPRCNERVELTVNAADVRAVSEKEVQSEVALSVAGYVVLVRPPASQDLIAAGEAHDAEVRDMILQRCLISVRRDGASVVSADPLPAEVVDAVMDGMARADPLADVQLSVCCPVCQHRWRAAFDIVSFLWSEIEAAASRLLFEIHRLASAYGWAEADILAMSATRRQFYLAMVGE